MSDSSDYNSSDDQVTPRREYPRPTLVREHWLNLNGPWHFQADPRDEGLLAQWHINPEFTKTIIVPFPIESEASGLHDLAPANVNWYSKSFEVPEEWQLDDLQLTIGACDHETTVFVNGQQVAQHRGGYSPIEAKIAHALNREPQLKKNTITIRVEDHIGWTQPRGKQAGTTKWPIDYDTVTGIWQTVWLEPIGKEHITCLYNRFDCATSKLTLGLEANKQNAHSVEVVIKDSDELVCHGTVSMNQRAEARLTLEFDNPKLWSPNNPFLYDVTIELKDAAGNIVDRIESYVGLREIAHHNGYVTINNEAIYVRGVLDQGYFPQGWYTATTDDVYKKDIELTLAMGFNSARKHQKIEDPRYLYWADRLGLLVWEEMPSGRVFSNELIRTLTSEWTEIIKRDRQHPSIMAWVPFNESWGVWHQPERGEQRAFVDGVVHLTKAYDQSRLVIGNDGWEFSSGDLWTLHLYEGESETIEQRLDKLMQDPESKVVGDSLDAKVGALPNANTKGLPIILTECGGIGFVDGDLSGDEFAYGDLPQTEQELIKRFEGVASAINSSRTLTGFVWTQLTDIQQEINGVLYFDRTPKIPISEIKRIMESTGSIEKTAPT